MATPTISIIIPLYNKRYTIKWTVSSVLNQSFSNFELIIIDDGSTDGSDFIVKEFKDSRIRYIYKENGGVSSARNIGIMESKSEWILFLDADDYLLEDALEYFYEGCKMYPQYKVITDYSNNMFRSAKRKWREINEDRLGKYSSFQFTIRTGNTLFHRSCFDKCGYFDESLSLYEDFKLFLDIIYHYPILQCNKRVFVYDTSFCGLSGVKGLLQTDFLMHLHLTGDTSFDKCLLNYIGMRYNMAKDSGEHDICNYIRENFPLENSLRLYNRSKKRSLSVHRKMKGLFFREIVSSLVRGNFEFKRKYLLSLAHSRFGKFGNNISVGRHFECERISNVFIYDNVIIGNNMVVKGNCGRLVIRSGVRIGNNFRVCTFDSVDKMNVIIGKKCVIGDNVCVHPGICITDGMVIPSNSIL